MSEGAIRAKAERLGFRDFSDLLRFNAPVGSRFPFHAHGDASLECQVAGSSRFYFLNQEPVGCFLDGNLYHACMLACFQFVRQACNCSLLVITKNSMAML